MKSKKRVITGQRLSIMFIVLALIVATLVTLVIMNFINKNKPIKTEQYGTLSEIFEDEVDIVAACERNSWGSDIVGSATKEDVPIPFGYEYKKGDLQTGTIIRETATGAELLWIPYQEDTSNYDISEYYKNADNEEIDSDTVKSISKYNGFYVYLNMNMGIEELKDVSNEKYKNYAKQLSSTGEFGDTHILTTEEIQQILAYTNKNKIELNSGVQAMTIGLYSTLVVGDEEVVSINKEGEVASTGNPGVQLATNDDYPKVTRTKSGSTYTFKYYKKASKFYIYTYNGNTVYYKGTNSSSSSVKLSGTVDEIIFTDGYIVYATEDGDVYALPIGKTGTSNRIEVGEDFESFEKDDDRNYFATGYNTTDEEYINFEDEFDTKEDEQDDDTEPYYVMIKDIPVPSGFKYNYTNGVMSIKSIDNPNLVYIWVPTTEKDLKNAKTEIKELYETFKDADGDSIDLDNELFDDTEEEWDEEFINSIEKFEGFYISEAELGYDSNNKFYNRARGMIGYSATNQVDGGDYFRGSSTNGSFNMNFVKSKAKESCSQESVVSHLMYGAEYDRTLLWIYETNNSRDMLSNLVFNSTTIGKYSNSERGENSTAAQSSKYYNGIWGLAGNLSELTQEKHENDRYIIRGGDWSKTGESAPMATREVSELKDGTITKSNTMGFRTCLYINPDKDVKEKTKKEIEEFEEKEETINNITFEKVNNPKSLYTKNWDGAKVYSTPNQGTEAIDNLEFATRFVVNSVAKNMTTKDIWWGKGTVNGTGQEVFINIIDLTQSVVIGNVDFVRGSSVTRYCDKNTMIYNSPSLQNGFAVGTEKIEVVGKSITGQWAILVKDGKEYYIESNKLRIKHTEQINGVTFDVLDEAEIKYNKNWDGLKAYSTPDLSGEAKHTYEFADNATVLAKAQNKTNDGVLVAKVSTYLGDLFINYNDLTDPEYIGEVPVIKSTAVERYYSGLTIFDAPNDNATSNKVDYGGAIQVVGKSIDKKWIVVGLGTDKYVKVEEIFNLPIVFKDAVTKYYHNGLTLYDNVKDGKTTKLEGDGSVSVVGTSIMDPNYSVIEKDGYKYVKTTDLLNEPYKEPKPAPAPEPKPEPTPEPTPAPNFTEGWTTVYGERKYIGTYYSPVIYRRPEADRHYEETKVSIPFGTSVVIKKKGKYAKVDWYEIDWYGATYYVKQSAFTTESFESEGRRFVKLLNNNTWKQQKTFCTYTKPKESIWNVNNQYYCGMTAYVQYLSTDKAWGKLSKYYIIMSQFKAGGGEANLKNSNNIGENQIKDISKLKMTINNTNVLCTRAEDGNIFINNLSTEKIMEKDYDIKVNYNE